MRSQEVTKRVHPDSCQLRVPPCHLRLGASRLRVTRLSMDSAASRWPPSVLPVLSTHELSTVDQMGRFTFATRAPAATPRHQTRKPASLYAWGQQHPPFHAGHGEGRSSTPSHVHIGRSGPNLLPHRPRWDRKGVNLDFSR